MSGSLTKKIRDWADDHRYVLKDDGTIPTDIGHLRAAGGPDDESWMLESVTSYDTWPIYPDLFNKDQDEMLRPKRRPDCTDAWVQHCHDRARRARASRKMADKRNAVWVRDDGEEEKG